MVEEVADIQKQKVQAFAGHWRFPLFLFRPT
jgi:hypothetical protein